jgi:hypothetical protein
MMMTFNDVVSYQRALAHTAPCELAEQCANPRYFFRVSPAQGVSCGVRLTVNVGKE